MIEHYKIIVAVARELIIRGRRIWKECKGDAIGWVLIEVNPSVPFECPTLLPARTRTRRRWRSPFRDGNQQPVHFLAGCLERAVGSCYFQHSRYCSWFTPPFL